MAATGEFVKVAAVTEIPEGSVKLAQAGDHKIVVCKTEGSFYAVADLCSHDNGPLGQGELIEGEIECPRHGARFNVETGQPTCLPAVLPIPTYKVEVRGEDLWVSTTPEMKAK